VITNAGGLGILCADACESAGLELPELTDLTRLALATAVPGEASLGNPVDLLGSATAATYEAVVPHVLADPNVDALIVIFVPPVVASAHEVAAAFRRAVDPTERDKPVIAVVISAEGTPSVLSEPGSPVVALPYPESAALRSHSPANAAIGSSTPGNHARARLGHLRRSQGHRLGAR
jgi:acyl-CoA synthetase (NDP forming)